MTAGSGVEIAALSFDDASSVTDEPALCEPWRAEFDASAGWVGREDIAPPRSEALESSCEAYGFPATASPLLCAHRDDWDEPRIRRLGAHVQWMHAKRYTPTGTLRLGWPPGFSKAPLFYALAALGLARQVARRQAARGIDVEITHATLRDIGQQIHLHQRIHGVAGMNKGWWLSHHLSDHLFRLGRLQYQRARAAKGLGSIGPDEPFLDVHIPEDGPLEPSACDAAFERSRAFFAQHFPEECPRYYACRSWLLDPALEGLLGRTSNIVRFQRRFDLDRVMDGPSNVFEFVFDRPDLDGAARPDPSRLPRDTRLRAALLDYYAAGGRIRLGIGTMPLAS